jgi:UDP-sulfoquinovose synthase
MRIFVLGGDGFCGWPTSLALSSAGHDVTIIDNLSRRNIDIELGCNSLTPIKTIYKRISTWNKINKKKIEFINLNLAIHFKEFSDLLIKINPDAIIHFAEHRAAPYSMKNSETNRYTVNNNLNATNNILASIVEAKKDIHLIHLGTMGVYGYGTAGLEIPEGYLKVHIPSSSKDESLVENEILYPTNPGSIYHMTKSQDQLFFQFYNKNYKLKITDLHQGIVWGTQTDDTIKDENLINRFDYDGDYGTVLNRFLMQSSLNYPLTVHGTGGQTRAFIHIKDTVSCIKLALDNPPKTNDKVKIINQMTETHKVRDLAKIISNLTNCEINFVDNPRKEADENELKVSNKTFIDLGLNPTTLTDGLMTEIYDIAKKYKSRCDLSLIPCISKW